MTDTRAGARSRPSRFTADRPRTRPLRRARPRRRAEPVGPLRLLSLSGSRIGDDGARAIAGSPHLARLEALFLARADLTDDGLDAIATSPHLKRLTRLGLDGNDLDAGAAARLRAALPALRVVEVRSR